MKAILKEQGRTLDWFCTELGIAVQTFHNRTSTGKWPGMDELYRIAAILGVGAEELISDRPYPEGEAAPAPDKTLLVPVLDQRLSAGTGQYVPDADEILEYVAVPAAMKKYGNNVCALRVSGDSMEPTLHSGEAVICDGNGYDGSEGIYALRLRGSGFVKRLQTDGKRIKIISDNPKYAVMEENAESDDIAIIGKIRYTVRRME